MTNARRPRKHLRATCPSCAWLESDPRQTGRVTTFSMNGSPLVHAMPEIGLVGRVSVLQKDGLSWTEAYDEALSGFAYQCELQTRFEAQRKAVAT